MRVMFVCTTGGSGRRQFGGAERFLVEMLPALARQGVDVLAGTPDDEVGAALREAGVPWTNLGAVRRFDPAYARQISREVARSRPDVVSAHLLSAAMHARAGLGVEGRRTPLVVALHNSLWQYRDAAGSLRGKAAAQARITLDLLLRRLRPHVTVAVSAFEADELRHRGGIRDVTVIPNPLPAVWPSPDDVAHVNVAHVGAAHAGTDAVYAGAGSPGSAAGVRNPARVGFLGRLEPEKGADLLSDIAARLPEVEFHIAGVGATEVAPRSNVHLVGRVDAAAFLSRIDCLVVPSRVESFGRSALEAMSLGVPVVHSGAGGLAEITARADGVLAYRADLAPDSMAAVVRTAIDGADRRAQRYATARWYAQEFSFARCVDNWRQLYRSVADGRR